MYSLKKFIVSTVTSLFMGQVLLAAAASGDIEREFEVQPGGTLSIDSDSGTIDVTIWSEPRVQVVVRNPDNFDVEIDQSGNNVFVTAEHDRGRGRLSFHVQIPYEFNVDLETGGGGINVGDISGNVDADTSGGNITIGKVAQGNVVLDTSGGNISVADVANGDVEVDTSGGRITLGNVNGNAVADTSGGNIDIGNVTGNLFADTSGGNITVGEVNGDTDLDTSGGTIRSGYSNGRIIANTSGGNIFLAGSDVLVDADTSGGNITIDRSGGPVVANTSGGNITIGPVQGYIDAATSGGSIRAELAATESGVDTHVDLESSGGDIELRIPGSHAATVSARIDVSRRSRGDYRIYTDFPLTISGEDESEVIGSGDINGGGDSITLETNNGDIRITSSGN